ncbi:hypothetical protein [Amycolatopsis palatopharyngis]|uniref:hypothetical protein n=1 Tax=Amycolatopsis palatopharyngis TaxID=187982 RepID=UPI000E280B40|nr:hypothetical protein [Amycolatopsis palatopharyngis]
MKIFELIGTPGTRLSCAADPRVTIRRGIGMSWGTQPANEMSSRAARSRNDLVQTFAGADAKAARLAFVPVPVDLPIYKQVSAPSSAHERSP